MLYLRRCIHALALLALALLCVVPAQAAQTPYQVAAPFRDYYAQHQGIRLLGYPLSDLVEAGGYAAQYFEKGRIEDHRSDQAAPGWQFMYGRLTAELIARDPQGSVSGTSLTYADLARAGLPARRHAPPAGFGGGVQAVAGGVFVPYDAALRPAPGYIIPAAFWRYLSADLFPGGWLHDVGLPMTDALPAHVYKYGQWRTIVVQAFERTVLTNDPLNPSGWQIERGNIGADALSAPAPAESPFISPAAGAQATLPLHILARLGRPGDQVVARLRWRDGTELMRVFPLLRGEDGQGLLIATMGWMTEGPPPQPPTQPATLEIYGGSGALQARQPLIVLSAADPATQVVTVYWVAGEQTIPAQIRIPRTPQIGAAALNELLWGPAPGNPAGFSTALPTPAQVLSYPGRGADWGFRVTLRKLTITSGVATADFSRELRAYGGGSLRVRLIRAQITQTLKQFSTVRDVRIAIEGQTEGVLEP